MEGQGAARAFCNKKGWTVVSGGVGAGATVDVTKIPSKRLDALRWITGLLEATQGRPPFLGCGGMHEWAMVYRTAEVRHRIAFLPDYDMSMARLLYWGCDVWLNNPRRPLEAS